MMGNVAARGKSVVTNYCTVRKTTKKGKYEAETEGIATRCNYTRMC